MAETIAILKTVKSGADVLWEFAKLVDRYRALPEKVYDLEENLHACQITLKRWKTKWGVEERQPDVFYEVLWSKRGWRAIRLCLGAIEDLANILKTKINEMIGSALKYQGRSRNNVYNGRFDVDVMKRALRRIDQSMSRRRRFTWAVLLKADELDGRIARFNTKLTNLERFAESYLFEVHPTLFGKEGPKFNKAKQNLIEDKLKEKRRSKVDGSRESALALHEAYLKSEGYTAHIALARYNTVQQDPGLEKDFHFIISDGPRSREVVFHPMEFTDSAQYRMLPVDMSGAFTRIGRSRVGLLLTDPQNGAGFELLPIARPSLSHLSTCEPLNRLVLSSPFSVRDKLTLTASVIAESDRLLGTPWLNYLSTTNIRGVRSSSSSSSKEHARWTAILQAKSAPPYETGAISSFLASRAQRSRPASSTLKHQQVFRLGLVLAEITLQSSISLVEISEEIRSVGEVSLVLPEVADGMRLEAEEIAAEVEVQTGSIALADVVSWCLGSLRRMRRSTAEGEELLEQWEQGVVDRVRRDVGVLLKGKDGGI